MLRDKDDSAWDDALIKGLSENRDVLVNPIYRWSDSEIWEYIRENNLKVNPLYYQPYNYKRVGCVFCPMASYSEKKRMEHDFPGFKKLYVRAFDKMIAEREKRGLVIRREWENGEEVYNWWIEEYKHNVKGQITLDEWMRQKDE